VFVAAYGHRLKPDGLLVAYALTNLLAVLPISPAGIGIIEGVLIPSLVGLGTPRGVAVLGVVSRRLFNSWAPTPLAGMSYTSLRAQCWLRRRMPDAGSQRQLNLGLVSCSSLSCLWTRSSCPICRNTSATDAYSP
jgi:hypothetical protein